MKRCGYVNVINGNSRKRVYVSKKRIDKIFLQDRIKKKIGTELGFVYKGWEK